MKNFWDKLGKKIKHSGSSDLFFLKKYIVKRHILLDEFRV